MSADQIAWTLYLWGALWTALIASRSEGRPKNQIELILGSIFLGILWPVTLPLHAILDLPDPCKSTTALPPSHSETGKP